MPRNAHPSGRETPLHVGHSGLRHFIKSRPFKAALAAASGLALMSVAPRSEAPPPEGNLVTVDAPATDSRTAADLVAREHAFMQEAYGNLVIIPFEQLDETQLERDLSGPQFRVVDRHRIFRQILAGLDTQGDFDTTTPQKNDIDFYLPNTPPSGIDSINAAVAYKMSHVIADGLEEGSTGFAVPMLLTPTQTEALATAQNLPHNRGCAVVVFPENMDADEFVRKFTGVNAPTLAQVDLQDIHQFVASHEFNHCMTSNPGSRAQFTEAYADLFGLARHIQVNGDDGFAELWRDMRHISTINMLDAGHDSYPLLKHAVPALLAAHEEGALQGLNARELAQRAEHITAESMGLSVEEMWAHVHEEQNTRRWHAYAIADMPKDAQGYITYVREEADRFIDEDKIAHIENMVAEYNTAQQRVFGRGDLPFVNSTTQTRLSPEQFAELRFRANLENFIEVQEAPELAVQGLEYKAWETANLAREEDAPSTLSGLSLNQRREILLEYAQQLRDEYQIQTRPVHETDRDLT